jgi:urea-proton symporter
MGIVVGSAVAPIYFCLTWNGCTAKGAITGAITGQIAAVITWLVTAQSLSGEITLESTGADYPMLAGNLVAIFLSAIITAGVSLMAPQNFDWAILKEIPVVEQDGSTIMDAEGEDSPQALNNAYKWTLLSGGGLSLIMVLVWPCLALIPGVFTKGYFYLWVSIAMIWGLLAGAACFLLPIWEARETIVDITMGVLMCKGRAPIKAAAASEKVVEATKTVA